MHSSNGHNLLCIALLTLLYAKASIAQTVVINPAQELQTYALLLCQTNNYQKINPQFHFPHDTTQSAIITDFVVLGDRLTNDLNQFIAHETQYFHLPTPHQEVGLSHPSNTIFSRCMDFYHSKALQQKIKSLLKQKQQNDRNNE